MAYTGVARTNSLLSVAGLSAAAAGNGTALQIPLGGSDDRMYVNVQASITGTLNVVIQGRIDANSAWTTLYTFTTSDGQLIARYPQMRATYNGASLNAAASVQVDVYCKPAL